MEKLDNDLIVKIVVPKRWWEPARYELVNDMEFSNGITVPKGFVSDGTTVSRWFVLIGIILIVLSHYTNVYIGVAGGVLIMLPLLFPRVDSTIKAAILHDYMLCAGFKRLEADKAYYSELISLNVSRLKAIAMFSGVVAFGFFVKTSDYL